MTPTAITSRTNRSHKSETAHNAVKPIVSHNSVMVSVFCLSGIPLPSR